MGLQGARFLVLYLRVGIKADLNFVAYAVHIYMHKGGGFSGIRAGEEGDHSCKIRES
jgi:hypothetical protein